MSTYPGCRALNYPKAGEYVWVRVPGFNGTFKAIAATDITSGRIALIGDRAFPEFAVTPKQRSTGKFLKVRPQEETARTAFVFLYEAIAAEVKKGYLGGFKGRSPINYETLYPEIANEFIAQIHWANADSVIGGVRVNPTFVDFDWVRPAIAVVSGQGQVSAFRRDEAFKVLPVGYGLWLAIADYPSLLAQSSSLESTNYAAVEPYLSGNGSEINAGGVSNGNSSGIAKSILIDAARQEVTATNISFTASSSTSGTSSSGSASASGETIVLPGVTRPCSFSFSTVSGGETSINFNTYCTVLISASKGRAIALHLNGNFAQNSKWLIFNGNDEEDINNRPGFTFNLLPGERRLPEVGSYTFGGRSLFTTNSIRVGTSTLILNPLTTTIVGTKIVWATQIEPNSTKVRKAFGTITSFSLEALEESGAFTDITVAIDRIVETDYDSNATYNGTIYSASGSVYDFLYDLKGGGLLEPVLGKGLPRLYEFGEFSLGGGGLRFNSPSFERLGYHWVGNTIYVANKPPIAPTENITNYAEVWQISNGNFIKQDAPVKGDRLPLLTAGETFGGICGAYWPES